MTTRSFVVPPASSGTDRNRVRSLGSLNSTMVFRERLRVPHQAFDSGPILTEESGFAISICIMLINGLYYPHE